LERYGTGVLPVSSMCNKSTYIWCAYIQTRNKDVGSCISISRETKDLRLSVRPSLKNSLPLC